MSGGDSARFGKYRLLQRIAAGGMGEVHLAKLKGPSGFEKLVVIKRLLDHRKGEQKYIDMFFSEARVAAQLNHSNIVQVYEVGNFEGVHYIAMEYVQGKSLRRVIDATEDVRRHLPPYYVAEIMVELCNGLAFAHEARHLSGAPMGLIHRDVNPHNVLLSYRGEVKVIDFGIAKSELTLEQTQAGTIKGTVVYMSPEQSSGHKLDRRSDLFAVGICMYEALTGHNPFHKDTLAASLEAIRNATYPPVTQDRPELLPFAPIVKRALARTPTERYDSAAELALAVRSLIETGVVPRAPVSLADYLHTLFADDISAEERLLSQTELAEVAQLTYTETLSSSPEQRIPEALGEEPTAHDVLPMQLGSDDAIAVVEPTRAMLPNEMPPAPRARPLPAAVPAPASAWPKEWVTALIAILALSSIAVIALLLRPVPNEPPRITVAPPPPAPPPGRLQGTTPPLGRAPAEPAPPAESLAAGTSPAPSPLDANRTPLVPSRGDGNENERRGGAHRGPPPHRHPKGRPTRPPEPPPEPPSGNTLGNLQFSLDPPVRVTLNGTVLGSSVRLRAASGILVVGSGSDLRTDPFIVRLRYKIEQKTIVFGVESDPWADVYGAGGIRLGRTPLQGVQGGNTTVFELRNPKDDAKSRITVRFSPP